jgi:hypothetical protein
MPPYQKHMLGVAFTFRESARGGRERRERELKIEAFHWQIYFKKFSIPFDVYRFMTTLMGGKCRDSPRSEREMDNCCEIVTQ